MDSPDNIITLREIEDFLADTSNIDIVRKHFKLWLHSSTIFSEIYNQNIFIDCEALLSDVVEDSKRFVNTSIYLECLGASEN